MQPLTMGINALHRVSVKLHMRIAIRRSLLKSLIGLLPLLTTFVSMNTSLNVLNVPCVQDVNGNVYGVMETEQQVNHCNALEF